MYNFYFNSFAVVTVGSEASSRTITEKMPKREIHGQNPIVLPGNKQSLNYFEGTTRKDEPMAPMNAPQRKFVTLFKLLSRNIFFPDHPIMRPPIGLPLPMPRGPMEGPYRFPPQQGPVMLSHGAIARPPMSIGLGPRGHVPGGPMVIGRMQGPHPPGVHPQQSVLVMQRPGVPPVSNGPPLARQPMAPGPQGKI